MNDVTDDSPKKFEEIRKKILSSVINAVTKDTTLLTNKIKNDKLSNNVLNVKTGNLRNSIQSRVVVSGNNVNGSVFSNSAYANAHEYGFNGSEVVKAHLRKISQVYGKRIDTKEVLISTFSRNMKIKEKSFMRSSLKEMEGQIFKDIEVGVKAGLNG